MSGLLKRGFAPVYDTKSRALILGSFPSVKSRKIEFYYGNPQNKFWRMLCGYFNADIPVSNGDKTCFLLKNKIALWDIVVECEIDGSKDATIKNYTIADLTLILNNAPIELIILNGGTAYSIFDRAYRNIDIPYVRLPSTSPANTRYDEKLWISALDGVFKKL